MSDYSNPNEICKVKHILSLAQSINDKIDGVTVTPTIKADPTLTIGSWSKADSVYSATITYDGDGTLSTSTGTISGTTLTVNDADGDFSGIITASAGTSYANASIAFNYDTETIIAGGKSVPYLYVSNPTLGSYDSVDIYYNGDGLLYLSDFEGEHIYEKPWASANATVTTSDGKPSDGKLGYAVLAGASTQIFRDTLSVDYTNIDGELEHYTLAPFYTIKADTPYITAYNVIRSASGTFKLCATEGTNYAVPGEVTITKITTLNPNTDNRPWPKFKAMYGGVIFEDEPTPVESQNTACLYVNASVSTATVPFYFQGDGTLYIADQQFYEGQPPCVLIAPNPDYDPTSNDSTQSAFYNWELIVHQGGFGYVRIASTETANYRESDDNNGKVRIYPPGSNFDDLKNSNETWAASTGLANGVASTLTTTPNPNWT